MLTTIIVLFVILIVLLIMSKIKSINIQDKTYHVWCEIIIPIIGTLSFYKYIMNDFWYSVLVGCICGIFAGFAKEYVFDKLMRFGVFSFADLKYSMLGVAIGTIASIMILGSFLHLGV